MSTAIQWRRGTTAQHATFTGLAGEVTVDTDKHVAVVHNGSTAGGFPLAKASDIPSLTGYATLADPTFTGNPQAPTPTLGDNDTSIATTGFVKAAIDVILGGVSASFDTLSELAAGLKGLGALTLAAGDILYASGANALARLAKGTDGQVLTLASGVPTWAAAAAASGTARNRIVNPSMQISSINGNTAGTTTGYVPADNWGTFRVTSAGTITTQRVQSATAAGSKDRARITITVADASLAAGEYLTFTQSIVGQEVADLLYGTASAKNIVVRFGFKGPAGTYAVHIGNSAANRSYVALFTISAGQANADTTQTVSIVGDTTGTWLTDTGVGLTLDIVLACGSTFQGVTGWQAGNLFGTSGVSNGMATVSAVFEIFDVGLYADPSATGTAPTFETPNFQDVYNRLAYTPWVAYTPTFTNLGTVTSIDFFSRRRGDNLEIEGKAVLGTTAAGEARVSLGYGGVSANVVADSTKVSSIRLAGSIAQSANGATTYYAMVESGVSYLTMSVQFSTNNALAKANGTAFTSTSTISIQASVPISGW
jgi:hypothetical protein